MDSSRVNQVTDRIKLRSQMGRSKRVASNLCHLRYELTHIFSHVDTNNNIVFDFLSIQKRKQITKN